ncbi:MAG: MotA/TolQ/ExbB proton channel family protein [Arenicella sp.]
MFEIFKAGGPLMWVLLLCSLIAVTIIIEKFWSLNKNSVVPAKLQSQIEELVKNKTVTPNKIEMIRQHSPLGEVLAAGISNAASGRDEMKQAIEESGRHVVHRLSRYLNTLGTISSVSPLVGLLGTVIGMIKVFTAITSNGVGDPTVLSGGISQALITTATGLAIGIASLMFYRFFRGRVQELTVKLEQNALRLVDAAHNKRT